MGVTFTSATERDSRRRADSARYPIAHQLLLALTSVVAMMAIGLSYSGRVRSNNEPESRRSQTNLNTVADSHALEPALGAIFANAVDRRFAAAHLFEYIDSVRSRGDSLPNVGAILGATVSADVIDRAPLLVYKERLRQACDRADCDVEPPPVTLPLLNADDLAAIKPAFVVRTHAARSGAWRCSRRVSILLRV